MELIALYLYCTDPADLVTCAAAGYKPVVYESIEACEEQELEKLVAAIRTVEGKPPEVVEATVAGSLVKCIADPKNSLEP